jgi:hypothetical protein
MNFRILGLQSEPFQSLYGLTDEELARRGARRYIADAKPGFPDRIEMRDADLREPLILVNYQHQSADTPYRASHAVFVREGAQQRYDACDEIPQVLARRTISLRAFDADHWMVAAELYEGRQLKAGIRRLLGQPEVAYLQAHYAVRGCYAARIERA